MTAETPVLDTLADITAASVEHNWLAALGIAIMVAESEMAEDAAAGQ